jgi:hypothetical protein
MAIGTFPVLRVMLRARQVPGLHVVAMSSRGSAERGHRAFRGLCCVATQGGAAAGAANLISDFPCSTARQPPLAFDPASMEGVFAQVVWETKCHDLRRSLPIGLKKT